MVFPADVLRLSELIADMVTGAVLQTAAAGNRIVIQGATLDGTSGGKVLLFSGDADEVVEARLYQSITGVGVAKQSVLNLQNGRLGGSVLNTRSILQLLSGSDDDGVTLPAVARFLLGSGGQVEMPKAQVTGTATMQTGTVNGNLTVGNTADVNTLKIGGQKVSFGFTTDVTDVNGNITAAHGLGAVPSVVIAQNTNTAAGFLTALTASHTNTNLWLKAYTTAGVVRGSGVSVPFNWLAIG